MDNIKNTKMAEMPVKKLMISMGLPMIISMILQAVYNIVDSAFVSNMANNGEEALNALTLAFPLQILMVAVGIGTGVGANVLIANNLGQKNSDKAGKVAGNGVFLGIVIYAVFFLFGILGSEIYIKTQTKSEIIAQMGTDYLKICCVLSFGMCLFSIYEKTLQACGHSVCSTVAQILGAVTNIVLDPILIYGVFGKPLGVKGAAYATVIGQIVSFIAAFILNAKFNKSIKIHLSDLKPEISIISKIYSVGVPAIISQALISVMTYGMNLILIRVSENMVTAYGLFYKIQQFLLFAAFGMRDAITPITAFNVGLGDKNRMKDCVKYGHLFTAFIMFAGFVILEVFARPFASLFGLSGDTLTLCISAIHIISVSFVFAGINIAFQGIFQALGNGIASLVISVCRQIVFIFPFAFIFLGIVKSGKFSSSVLWTVFPIAEILTAIVAFMLYKKSAKTAEI